MEAAAPTLQDHPRSRGVYSTTSASVSSPAGSSPLARGLLGASVPPLHAGPGIIPARAGFTETECSIQPERVDHPRSRGVYSHCGCTWYRQGGSSPLARGLQAEHIIGVYRHRIIPARAGFTRPARDGRGAARDHPRSRGVYIKVFSTSRAICGSSPLARGLPTIRRMC